MNLDERIAALAEPSSAARARRSDLRAQLKPQANRRGESGKAASALLAMLQPGFTPTVEGEVLHLGLAARRLRIGTAQARQLVDLGILPSCYALGGGERQHDRLASDVVARLQAQLSDRISLTNLGVRTNVAVKLLVGLGRAGHLRTVDNEPTRLLYKEMQFHLSAIDELGALKRKVQRHDPADPGRIRLRDLFPALGVGAKPWVRAILESADAGQLGAPETREMSKATLNVSLDWARRVVRGKNAWACRREIEAESISLIDAEEYLNMLPKDTSCLIAHGQLQRGGVGVTAQSVRRCSRLFVSTKEVGVRAGVESIQVAGLAAQAGVARPYRSGGFWPRDRIEAALDLPPPGSAALVLRWAIDSPDCADAG
ncbi:hypothetical protein ACIPQB_10555 [Caulobacter sp. LARHSG274]